jgi:protein phosphatase
MSLFVDAGFCTRRGPNPPEHESCLLIVPDPQPGAAHGVLLAVADPVAGRPQPGHAARDALQALASSYYAAPEHWALTHALHESMLAAHHAVRGGAERGRAVSLSALTLRGQRYALAHAGDTRVWLWRDGEWRLLTRDHIIPRARRAPEVSNACGLGEGPPEIELASGELAEGDVFVLATRAVYEPLDSPTMMSALLADASSRTAAERLVERALATGGKGQDRNLSVCVVRVEQLPPRTESDTQEETISLPIVPPPSPGDTIDGFHIEALVHTSRTYRLYRALDAESGQTVILKFPNPKFRRDPAFPERFLREEWVCRRVAHPHLMSVLPLRRQRRTALYSVLTYCPGENLHQRLRRKQRLSVKETLLIGRQLLEALAALHRQGVIHRDVRPKNIIFDKKAKSIRLLGLGASHDASRLDGDEAAETASGEPPRGTLAYTAPELHQGGPPSVQSDVYAAGVTLYRLLTGKYPYGKTRVRGSDGARPVFVSPARYRDDVPPFLEEALARACALDPRSRFESAEAFAAALEEDPIKSYLSRPAAVANTTTGHHPRPALAAWALAGILIAGLALYLAMLIK